MSIVMQLNPFELFVDASGKALDAGYIYVGTPNTDPRNNPVTIYYDAALSLPAPMPLRTVSGYVYRNGSPAQLYVNGNYSVMVLDKTGRQVYYVPDFLMVGNGTAVSLSDLSNTTDPTKGISIIPTAARLVGTIAELRTLPKTGGSNTALLLGYYARRDSGQRVYSLDTSDTTSTDNGGTIIVATDGGRWKMLVRDNTLSVTDFGALGIADDDAPAIQAAINWAIAQNVATTEGPIYKVTSPVGLKMNVKTALSINCPIKFEFNGQMISFVTTGAAIVVGGVTPTRLNTFYDIYVASLRCSPTIGNTANPTGITPTMNGIELRSVQFSKIKLDQVIAFKGYGVFLNASNNVFSGQHIQDNDIILGQVAYCGIGVYAPSADAALGAVQVNRITVQNFVTNFQHMILGNPNGLDNNTNNNQVNVIAMEGNTSGGSGVEIRGSFNDFYARYSSVPIALVAPGNSNKVSVGNNFQTGASFFDNQTGYNEVKTATPNDGTIPSALAQVFGNTYTNSYGVPVDVNLSATLNPTTTVAGSVAVRMGKTVATMTTILNCAVGFSPSPAATVMPLRFKVPTGWMWSITTPDSTKAAISSANLTIAVTA